ncbi:MAG: phosphohistidine phosphatase SixA [Verrucomicrobiales bacterium]|nr:phosphohistidine phosphatase SixA [Verrucomicrobiales bacterium]
MNLLLLRHSNAADQPPPGKRGDRFRRLTPEGREKAAVIGRAIQRLDLGLELILTSPADRALETAERVRAALNPRPPLELLEDLWIGGDPGRVVARLGGRRSKLQSVLLVGHEPDLGRFASELLTGGSGMRVIFKKGGLCGLEILRLTRGRCASMAWHLTPRQLLMLGGRGTGTG